MTDAMTWDMGMPSTASVVLASERNAVVTDRTPGVLTGWARELVSPISDIVTSIWTTWGVSNSAVLNAAPLDVAFIQRAYQMRDLGSILPFLGRHPYVIAALIEATTYAREAFPDAVLVLDRIVDPEADSPETAEQLALVIVTSEQPAEAMRRLRRLETDWWISTSARIRNSMYLDLEFM